ncbi:hypothetical protein D9M70_392390 [compost metagenome]
MVLQRRAGGQHAEVRLQSHRRLGAFGLGILDGLRFVEHDTGPAAGRKSLAVLLQQAVADDQQVHGAQVLQAARLVVEVRSQARGEAGAFGAPVEGHRGGGDHQLRALRRPFQEQGQDLHGLAQAHVVGQAGADAPVRQPGQPVEALQLVVAQLGLQRAWQLWLVVAHRGEALEVGAPVAVSLEGAGLAGQRLQERRTEGAELQAPVGHAFGQAAEFFQLPAQAVVQGQPVAVAQVDEAPRRGLEQFQQLAQLQDLAVVQVDAALQDEPVAPLLQAQVQLAQGGATPDAHVFAFRPDALQRFALQGLQLAEDLQGVLGLQQLPFGAVALGQGQARALFQHLLEALSLVFEIPQDLDRLAVLLPHQAAAAVARAEPAATAQGADQQLQAQPRLQRQQVNVEPFVRRDGVECAGQFRSFRVDSQHRGDRGHGLDQLCLG